MIHIITSLIIKYGKRYKQEKETTFSVQRRSDSFGAHGDESP
jgi:hypothetical protein